MSEKKEKKSENRAFIASRSAPLKSRHKQSDPEDSDENNN